MRSKVVMLSILVLLLSIGAFAEGVPSAKFAATYTTEPGLASVAYVPYTGTDTIDFDASLGYTLATIKVPQDKELLVGVSAEIGLVTDTSIKGKNGGTARAIADAVGSVALFAVPRNGGPSLPAAPGPIVLSKRFQALDATLGGVIQSCQVSCFVDTADTDGDGDVTEIICNDINIATDCVVTDEEIGLLQATMAAHHFNFVLPDMDQGVYDIVAVFFTGAFAAVNICEEGEPCMYDPDGVATATAAAAAIIGKTMVTVQQVRAAKGGVIDSEIEEIF